MNLTDIQTIFFDYDGTLHNSMVIYKPAFLSVFHRLVDQGYMSMRTWSDRDISRFLGQSPKEMWDDFGKNLPIDVRQKASQDIGRLMYQSIENGEAVLYDGAIETLNYLKQKGYCLVFLSNCSNAYMESHTKIFDLDFYFDVMINAEMYEYQSKKDILTQLKPRFSEKMLIVGDRHHDFEAGQVNDIFSLACVYGYGSREEIDMANDQIQRITELMSML